MFAVIRVRGPIKVNKDIEHTLALLNLTRANHCVLVPETDEIKGMLNKAKDYITWGEINKDILSKLLKKRGKVYTLENKLIDLKDTKENINNIVEEILSKEKSIKDYNIKKVFRLKPPSKGYDKKGIKKSFKQGGVLGYRSKHINVLLKKMI
jgi:large subunit ribosomal protein L30